MIKKTIKVPLNISVRSGLRDQINAKINKKIPPKFNRDELIKDKLSISLDSPETRETIRKPIWLMAK